FRLVVLDGKGTFHDFVAVAEIVLARQLLLDLAAVLQRDRAIDHVAVLLDHAVCRGRVPRLDGAKVTYDRPDLRRQTRRLSSLLDRDCKGRAVGKKERGQAEQGKFRYAHAFPPDLY